MIRTIKFSVPFHAEPITVKIDDDLLDTWMSIDIGEVPAELTENASHFTHDLNVWIDDEFDIEPSRDVLYVAVYPISVVNGELQTDYSASIRGEILECDDETISSEVIDGKRYWVWDGTTKPNPDKFVGEGI